MLKNPEEEDATQAIRWLTRDEQVVGWGRERKAGVAVCLRLKVGRRSRVDEDMVGVVGRVGVGNGCQAWLRWCDCCEWVRLKVERRRSVGVGEGWKATQRGRQV